MSVVHGMEMEIGALLAAMESGAEQPEATECGAEVAEAMECGAQRIVELPDTTTWIGAPVAEKKKYSEKQMRAHAVHNKSCKVKRYTLAYVSGSTTPHAQIINPLTTRPAPKVIIHYQPNMPPAPATKPVLIQPKPQTSAALQPLKLHQQRPSVLRMNWKGEPLPPSTKIIILTPIPIASIQAQQAAQLLGFNPQKQLGSSSCAQIPKLKTGKDQITPAQNQVDSLASSLDAQRRELQKSAASVLAAYKRSFVQDVEALNCIRICRKTLEEWVHYPFFDELVKGCYVRIGVGIHNTINIYQIYEILEVVQESVPYQLGDTLTKKSLRGKFGDKMQIYKMEFVSGSPFTRSEFEIWKLSCEKAGILPYSARLGAIQEKAVALAAANQQLTDQDVQYIGSLNWKWPTGLSVAPVNPLVGLSAGQGGNTRGPPQNGTKLHPPPLQRRPYSAWATPTPSTSATPLSQPPDPKPYWSILERALNENVQAPQNSLNCLLSPRPPPTLTPNRLRSRFSADTTVRLGRDLGLSGGRSGDVSTTTVPDAVETQVSSSVGEIKAVVRERSRAPHLCTTPGCGQFFSRRVDFDKHVAGHTGVPPYQCQVCKIVFAGSSSLKVHMTRFHTGEKPYTCDLCPEKFVKLDGKRKHEAQAHSSKVGEKEGTGRPSSGRKRRKTVVGGESGAEAAAGSMSTAQTTSNAESTGNAERSSNNENITITESITTTSYVLYYPSSDTKYTHNQHH